MKRFFKKFLKAVFYFFASFFIIVSIVLMISQTEKFRIFLHDRIESELKKSLGGEVHLGKFYGNIFTGLGVDGFHISVDGRTFIKALSLELKYDPIGLIKGSYSFRELILYKPEVYLIRGREGKWNFQKVFKPSEKKGETKFSFACDRFVIDDGKFALIDSLSQGRSQLADSLNCIDYHNFVVHDINAVFSGNYSPEKIDLERMKLSFVVDENKLSAEVNGKVFVDKNRLRANDFEIITSNSRIRFNFFAETKYNLFKLDEESIQEVYMSLSLRADSFSFGEFVKFIPQVYFLSGSPSVEVEAEGTLKDLKVKNIGVRIYNSDVFISGELKNIAKFSDFLINAEVKNSKIKVSDINEFFSLVKLPEFGVEYVEVDGRYVGHPLEFNSELNLKFGNSLINLNGGLKIKDNFAYNLSFKVSDLDPSALLSRGDLKGSLNLSGNLSGEGVEFETMKAQANLDLRESVINKVLIPKSSFWFEIKNAEINGSLVSLSEGLKGLIDLNLKKSGGDEYVLSLSGSLSELDVSQIRVDRPYFLKSRISGDFNLKLWFGKVSRMDIFAQLNPSTFGNYKINRLRLNAKYIADERKKNLVVQSNMFDLNLEGDFNYNDLNKSLDQAIRTIVGAADEKLNFTRFERPEFWQIENPVYVEYKLKLKNLTPISVFSIGQLFQAVGTLNGSFLADSQGFYFYGDADLRQIKYISYRSGKIDTFMSDGFKSSVELSYDKLLKFKIKGGLKEFISSSFKFGSLNLNLSYNEPEFYAEISADGKSWNFETALLAQFSQGVNKFILMEFNGDVSGNRFSLIDEIEIFQTKSGVIINPGSFAFNEQKIYVAGFIDKQGQQLRIWGENLKLDKLSKNIAFYGDVDFSVFVYGTHDKPSSEVEVFIKDFRYKDVQAGEVKCFGKIEDDMIKLNSSLVINMGEVNYNALDISVSIPMWFNPNVKARYREPYVVGKLRLFRFPVAIFETVIKDISDLKGDITADIDFSGTFDKPNFNGKFSLQNCIFKFNQNKKYYLVYGNGRLDSNVVYVDDLNLWNNPDDYGDGEVQIKGKVYLEGFSVSSGDFKINGKLLVVDKEGFGTTGIYGRVIAETGSNGLSLKIDTTGFYLNGEISLSDVNVSYLPRQAVGMGRGTGFEYVYVSSVDTLEKVKSMPEELVYLDVPIKTTEVQGEDRKKNGFLPELNYDLKISTSREAKLNIILNSQTGEEFYAEFTGDLNLRHFSGSTLAHGEVSILDRSYYNFFKRFNASGKLKFTGDLNNPELDITASYTGTHTVLTDTLGAGKVETILIQLLISGTLSKPSVRIQMFVNGEDYQKVYPHGEVESDAISFLMTGRFKDELTSGEVSAFTENLWSSTGASLLSGIVSGVITDVLRDILGGFITSTEIGYYSGFKGLRITGNIGGAIVQIGGDIFTDISKSVVVVQYPLFRKLFGGSLTIEYQRKPVQFYQEKEILNKLGLYYRIRL